MRTPTAFIFGVLAASLVAAAAFRGGGQPLDSTFTYQGQLRNAGQLVNGNVDVRFTLWDSDLEACTTLAATGTLSASGSSSGSSSHTKRRETARAPEMRATALIAPLSPEPSIPRELARLCATLRDGVLSSPFSRALSSVG